MRHLGKPLRIAYVGGGSMFVASIAHGIAASMAPPDAPAFAAELALVDPDTERAERMADYVGVLARSRRLPLAADVRSPAAALDGADLVLCSAGLPERGARLEAIYERLGWAGPAEGPGAVAAAVAMGPFFLGLAREAVGRCPGAPLVSLVDPTDVLAGAARRRFGHAGLRPLGLCVEVEGLRGALAFGFGVPEEDVTLVHGGVNHVGWVARFLVAGRDGYADLGGDLAALGGRAGMHPANRMISEIYGLTGLIRSSAYHAWPLVLTDAPPEAEGAVFPNKGRFHREALNAALEAGRPIPEPPRCHPEASPLHYPGTGRAVGRMARALATGEAAVVALQLPYAGEALGWSPEITVEVPAVVTHAGIDPVQIGPLPPGVDGLPRMLGQQRAMGSDYLAGPDEPALRRALAATPQWGSVGQIRALAAALHAEFGAELDAAVCG